jgi:hypothetical protein
LSTSSRVLKDVLVVVDNLENFKMVTLVVVDNLDSFKIAASSELFVEASKNRLDTGRKLGRNSNQRSILGDERHQAYA